MCTYMHYIICGCQMEYLFINNPDVIEYVWYEVPGYMIIIQPQPGTPKWIDAIRVTWIPIGLSLKLGQGITCPSYSWCFPFQSFKSQRCCSCLVTNGANSWETQGYLSDFLGFDGSNLKSFDLNQLCRSGKKVWISFWENPHSVSQKPSGFW